jgi:hypothetical protein
VRQVTQGAGEQNIMPTWSGDGASLYLYRILPSASFRRIAVDGGTSREVVAWNWLTEQYATVDRQGRFAAYTMMDGGPKATVVRDLNSGKELRLPQPMNRLEWSPDSKTIYGDYVSPDPAGDIWNRWIVGACPADGTPCRTLARGFAVTASPDGSRLYYVRDTGAARNMRELWTMSADGANPRKLTDVGPLFSAQWDYDVNSKGLIVFTRLNASRRELWAAQLK